MALGAERRDVLRLMLWQGVKLSASGLALGLALSLALTRALRGMLHGVNATDPVIFGSVCAVLMVAALLATLIPAWRAARVDPLVALRHE